MEEQEAIKILGVFLQSKGITHDSHGKVIRPMMEYTLIKIQEKWLVSTTPAQSGTTSEN